MHTSTPPRKLWEGVVEETLCRVVSAYYNGSPGIVIEVKTPDGMGNLQWGTVSDYEALKILKEAIRNLTEEST